jgi:hypothetical protein
MFESALVGAGQLFVDSLGPPHRLAQRVLSRVQRFLLLRRLPGQIGSLQEVLVELEVLLQHCVYLAGLHFWVQPRRRSLPPGTPGVRFSLLDQSLLEVGAELVLQPSLVILQVFYFQLFFLLNGFDIFYLFFGLCHHVLNLGEVLPLLLPLEFPHLLVVEQGFILQELPGRLRASIDQLFGVWLFRFV